MVDLEENPLDDTFYIDAKFRKMREYQEGANSYALGESVDDSGYDWETDERMAWLAGWYDARTNDSLGHLFKRHGMVHP